MSADKYTPDQWLLIRLQRCSTDYSQSMHVRAQAESDAAERIQQLLTINAELLAALQMAQTIISRDPEHAEAAAAIAAALKSNGWMK